MGWFVCNGKCNALCNEKREAKMQVETCPECGNILVIDEWDGWVWKCFICDVKTRPATDEEIKDLEAL